MSKRKHENEAVAEASAVSAPVAPDMSRVRGGGGETVKAPTTAEAFATVRMQLREELFPYLAQNGGASLKECEERAEAALALLERRMGAMERILEDAAHGGCEEIPGPCGDCLACNAKAAARGGR